MSLIVKANRPLMLRTDPLVNSIDFVRVEDLDKARVRISHNGEIFVDRVSQVPLFYRETLDGKDLHVQLSDVDIGEGLTVVVIEHPDALTHTAILETMEATCPESTTFAKITRKPC